MAEDDVFSAIWSSLVRPPTTVEDESTVDFSVWNDCNGETTVEHFNNNNNNNNYAEEGILANHSAQYYHDGTVDYWNRREMVQDYYPQEEVFFREAATVVDVKTLFDAVEEDGKAMVYWNEQEEITVHGYPEDGEAFAGDEIPADVVVESIFCSAADVQRSTEDVRSEPHSDKQTADGTNRLTYGSDEPLMIYRMPETVATGEKTHPFKPKFLHMGLYHHGEMKTMDSVKRFKEYCVEKVYRENKKVPGFKYARELMKTETQDEVKKYYDKYSINEMRSIELARSLMLDACSILVLLKLLPWMKKQLEANYMESEPQEMDQGEQADPEMESFPFTGRREYRRELWNKLDLTYDILPIENQIPFFVIDMVYNIFMGKSIKKVEPLRNEIAKQLSESVLRNYPTSLKKTSKFKYILHYCHDYFRPSDLSTSESKTTEHPVDDKKLNGWYGAADLYKSGIKFKGLPKPKGRSLLDIKFNKGKLEMPTLVIDDQTSLLFSNIIAFEKSLRKGPRYFASYVRFMSKLIVRTRDVELLVDKNIIKINIVKKGDVVDLFNKLMRLEQTSSMSEKADSYLKPIYVELNKYRETSSNKWKADIYQKYFKTPTLMIGLAIGALILACTIISAVAAIYGIERNK